MKLSLLSQGADPLAHLRSRMANVEQPAFSGSWAAVEVQPDLFSLQRFCVGIVLQTDAGHFDFRLISDAKKFECVYGSSGAVLDLLSEAESALQRAKRDSLGLSDLHFRTQNLLLSELMPAAGASEEVTIDRLFREVVVMERAEKKTPTTFKSLDTREVRNLVARELKRLAGIAYEQLAIGSEEVLVSDGETTHLLDVTYRSRNGVGNLVSAVVKTPDTAEINVLRGLANLETFARIKKMRDRALFIMSPKQSLMTGEEYRRVMEPIEEYEWKLEQQRVRVVTFDEAEPLAAAVLEWAQLL